jgi:hypothetical protein
MASTDSKAAAFWGVAHRITYPMLDADGDLVTGATTPDAEISKDAGTFADCTNESTEIATASGVYYLDLTATEMEADQIVVIAKSATAGMKTTVIVIYPEQGIRTRKATAGAAGTITLDASANATDDFYNDTVVAIVGGTGVGQSRLISNYTGASKVVDVVPNWVTAPDATSIFHIMRSGRVDIGQWVDVAPSALIAGRVDASVGAMQTAVITAAAHAAGAIDAAAIAPDAIGALELAADAITEIQAGLATSAALATVQADTDDIQARLPATLSAGKMRAQVEGMDAGTVTAAAVATDAIDGDAIAATAVTEIQAGLATSAALAVVQADTDDVQARLPATLSAGKMRSQVEGLDADVITAASIAAAAIGVSEAPNLDAAVSSRAAPGAAMTLTAGERDSIAAALLDLANGTETGYTVRQALRLIAAAVASKVSGEPGAPIFRNLADTANRISATVDANGNRTVVTHTP